MSDNTLAVVSEIWGMMRDSLPTNDVPDLAEGVVSTLLDYGYDLEDIRAEFPADTDILDAVAYFDETATEEEPEYEDYSDDEDEEW
jgi:hypothetical protein